MLRHSLRLSLLASALLLLPACGGGGGGSAANEQTETFTLTELLPEGYSSAEFQCSHSAAKTNSLYFYITKGSNQGKGNVIETKITFYPGASATEVWKLERGEGSWEAFDEPGFLGLTIQDVASSTTPEVSIPGNNTIQMFVTKAYKRGGNIFCQGNLKTPTQVGVKKDNVSKWMTLDGASFEYIIYP